MLPPCRQITDRYPAKAVHGLPDDEIAFFADGLTDHQRTFLHRLLGECLSSVPSDVHDGHDDLIPPGERLIMVRDHMRPLQRLLVCLRQFENNDENSDIRPFSVHMPEPGHALVTLSTRLATWRGIWEASSHAWVEQLAPGKVTVDVSRVPDLPSAVIAWLVTLATRLPSRRVFLVHASPRISQALRVLKLDHTLVVVTNS